MSDSCNPRKLDPGLDARYSKPRDLITSTMKSEPGRFVVRTSMPDDSVAASAGGGAGARNGCVASAPAFAASVATPPSAAPFRKFRRSTAFLDLSMTSHLPPGGVSVATYVPSYAFCQCFILAG